MWLLQAVVAVPTSSHPSLDIVLTFDSYTFFAFFRDYRSWSDYIENRD
jgi:hypothetical protein